MGQIGSQRQIIENIRKEIEDSKDAHIWKDYVNALKLISQVVFTRSSGFILELIQNAEDAGLEAADLGVFRIRINQHRVKIVHNGRPFTEDDVRALCGIRSSKKPERGTLGYLGIGFKSVFKVTDAPEVYSNGFHFKFARNFWDDPANTPWHVMPIWIEQPSEPIDANETTFIIPYREESYHPLLLEEVGKLRTELYLFLRWLKKIEVINEISGQMWTLENAGRSEDGITTLKQDGKATRFKFFHRTLEEIPGWVKEDRLTQEYRANVTKRHIAIAFALDKDANLAPSEAGAMYGGVYSFLPLGEARSGAKFPIQADFLVQPGRDAINYEAKWNHWLVDEVASLCREAIQFFKQDDRWKYQFLPAVEFSHSKNLESYDRLFGPKLIMPLEEYLDSDDCVPTADGTCTKPHFVVRCTEDPNAIQGLVNMDILREDQIAPVMGGQPELKLISPRVIDRSAAPTRVVDRGSLLENADFLGEQRQRPDAAAWFRNLYLWLAKNPIYVKAGRSRYSSPRGYHQSEFVLTSTYELLTGGKVWLPDLPPGDPILRDLASALQQSGSVLHPDILAGARDENEQKTLKGFLTGLTGVQVLDSKTVCKEAILPKILATTSKPSVNELLKYTTYCQKILGRAIDRGLELWVLTKQGDIRAAKETFFPLEFKPEQDWETHQEYVSGISLISPLYLSGVATDGELKAWREFFKAGGVRDAPDNGVEEFAMNYAEEKLKTRYVNVVRVDKRNFGYDVEVETQSGDRLRVEVKGLASDKDPVDLTGNETKAADKYKDAFFLCVVASIPERPAMYMVQNPAAVGEKEKLTVPPDVWRAARWL